MHTPRNSYTAPFIRFCCYNAGYLELEIELTARCVLNTGGLFVR